MPEPEKPLASHLLIELGGCSPESLNDAALARALVKEVAALSGSTLLQTLAHRFSPQGVTAIGLLAESHVSIHTWPERGAAAVDLMTCRWPLDCAGVARLLEQRLGAQTVKARLVDRPAPSQSQPTLEACTA